MKKTWSFNFDDGIHDCYDKDVGDYKDHYHYDDDDFDSPYKPDGEYSGKQYDTVLDGYLDDESFVNSVNQIMQQKRVNEQNLDENEEDIQERLGSDFATYCSLDGDREDFATEYYDCDHEDDQTYCIEGDGQDYGENDSLDGNIDNGQAYEYEAPYFDDIPDDTYYDCCKDDLEPTIFEIDEDLQEDLEDESDELEDG
jgi:hypothetical protein